MAEIQGSLISELGTTTINGTEKIPVEKGSANNHVTTQQVKEFVKEGMKISELENDSHFATQQNVKDEIAKAQLGGGGEVDTSGFATKEELTQALTKYVEKVVGKDLSTNDFSNVLKQKLEGLENYDDAAMQQAIKVINTRIDTLVGTSASSAIDTFNEIEAFLQGITDSQSLTKMLSDLKSEITALIPTKTSQLQNDTNFIADPNYQHTDCNYTQEEKDKLAGLKPGGDGSLSDGPLDVTDSVESDIDFADQQGNTVLRIANGHIKTKYFDSQNPRSFTALDRPTCICHGYGATKGPANSIGYFRLGWEKGYRFFEVDVVNTTDGISVCGHLGHDDVYDSSDQKHTVPYTDVTYEELMQYTKTPSDDAYCPSEPIPTLKEVIYYLCYLKRCPLWIDGSPADGLNLVKYAENLGVGQYLFFERGIPEGAISNPIVKCLDISAVKNLAEVNKKPNNNVLVNIGSEMANNPEKIRSFCDEIHKYGMFVSSFTFSDKKVIRTYFMNGADFLITSGVTDKEV